MAFRKFVQWAFGNFTNIVAFGVWLVSAGFFPALLKLTTGATPLQYGIAAVAGLIAFAAVRVCWNVARVLKATAKARERLTAGSTAFDPMERTFIEKRLYLRDLVLPGRRRLDGRKFIRCEIIGPGNIVVALRSKEGVPFPTFKGNWFDDVDMIQVQPGKESKTAIYFPDCDFEGCYFYNINLMFFDRLDESWWWITQDPSKPQSQLSSAISTAMSAQEGEKP